MELHDPKVKCYQYTGITSPIRLSIRGNVYIPAAGNAPLSCSLTMGTVHFEGEDGWNVKRRHKAEGILALCENGF